MNITNLLTFFLHAQQPLLPIFLIKLSEQVKDHEK